MTAGARQPLSIAAVQPAHVLGDLVGNVRGHAELGHDHLMGRWYQGAGGCAMLEPWSW